MVSPTQRLALSAPGHGFDPRAMPCDQHHQAPQLEPELCTIRHVRFLRAQHGIGVEQAERVDPLARQQFLDQRSGRTAKPSMDGNAEALFLLRLRWTRRTVRWRDRAGFSSAGRKEAA